MIILKLAFGIFFFLLGLVYLYKPNLVLWLNRIARDVLFNDRQILLERKKLAIVFFCVSFIALYMGATSFARWQQHRGREAWGLGSVEFNLYLAMQDYCDGNYQDAHDRYQQILSDAPNHPDTLKHLARTYSAMGEHTKAGRIWLRLSRLIPQDQEVQSQLHKIRQ